MSQQGGALVTPKWAVWLGYAYLFIYYTRIQDNIPGLNVVPWVGVLFLLFNLWGVTKLKKIYFSMPIGLVFWLGLIFALSGIGAISVVSYKLAFKWVSQIFPQCIALFTIFSSWRRMRSLHNFWCLIYFFMAVFTIKNAPLGAGDFTRDPNDACLALGMGIPFVFYATLQDGIGNKMKVAYYCTLVLLVVAIVMTSSRGGFLGLIAGILTMWWLSNKRVKLALFGFLGLLTVGGMVLSFLPSGYVEDMKSISDKKDNTRIERLRTWEIAWEMFKSNPVLGVGAGNFSNTVHVYQSRASWWTGEETSLSGRATHSLFFQVLSELGFIGVLIYGSVIIVMPLKLLSLTKALPPDGEKSKQLKLMCYSLIASMAVYSIAGFFISVAYYPHIYIWLVMYAIVNHLAKDIVVGG